MKKVILFLAVAIFFSGFAPAVFADIENLTVNKTAINLSSGNLNWSSSQNASPSDVIKFSIAFQAGSQDLHNVSVRDILPNNLNYYGNLEITGASNYGSGDIGSGINFDTIPAGGAVTISYQAQVAPSVNFGYGTAILNNNVSVTSNETSAVTDVATIYVNNAQGGGPTYVPTGLTNNFFTDSFLIPLLLITFGSWFYFTGRAYKLADWVKSRRA